MTYTSSDRARFRQKFTKTETCWLWNGNLSENGYGIFLMNGTRIRAHRAAYEMKNGAIPDGLCALHQCDVRNCVNPKHLFLGTRADNCQDCKAKGRTATGAKNGMKKHPDKNPVGERNGMARLTRSIASKIRSEAQSGTKSQSEIAQKYGVVQQTVSDILRGRRWGRALRE